MTQVSTGMTRPASGSPVPVHAPSAGRAHPWAITGFLRTFFFLARHAWWIPALLRPFMIQVTIWVSSTTRSGTARNARRLFGRELKGAELRRHTWAVVGNFFDFIVNIGRGMSAQTWRKRVAEVTGRAQYDACRTSGRGAILLTLHMGSFEAGLAALRSVETDVSVVFQRDIFADFESARAALRRSLGVKELALDNGMAAIAAIPTALRRNGVVVMQGDRAHPGQKAQIVPFLHGHLRLPMGPIRLARLCGSPVVPVASIRRPDGRFAIHLGTPIAVTEPDSAADALNRIDPDLRQVAAVFERWVAAYPEQWLVLRPAFVEDEPPRAD